jgi:hypothetical protein
MDDRDGDNEVTLSAKGNEYRELIIIVILIGKVLSMQDQSRRVEKSN